MAVLTNNISLDLGVLLLTIFGAAYLFFCRHYRKWEKKGIPFMKPLPFVGNFKDVALGRKNMEEVLHEAYDACKGQPVMGMFAFDHPVLVIRDLELVKHVLVKDFNYFMDRRFAVDTKVDPLFGRGIFAAKGQRWKHLRINLTPAFTSGRLKNMFTFLDECGKDLVRYLDRYTGPGQLEIKEAMTLYTTDVFANCAFGIQGNALKEPNSDFRRFMRKVFEFSFFKGIKSTLAFFAPGIMLALKLKLTEDEVEDFVRNTIWSTVEHRKKNGVVRKDLLELLMQIKEKGKMEGEESVKSEQKFELEGDDFVAQAYVFLLAGFETSASTMSFTLYELALQPDIQSRLRREIHSALEKNNGELTYEILQDMTYLDMVVSETLRKYPIAAFLDRQVVKPYNIPGTNFHLDKGDTVFVSLTGIHHDPEYYPDPERYDPERFTEENKRQRPNYTYMPFGEGPRTCVGKRMGLMQAKVGLVHLVSSYEVSPCKDTPKRIEFDPGNFLLASKGGIPLAIRKA